jgi:hypothetical protein
LAEIDELLEGVGGFCSLEGIYGIHGLLLNLLRLESSGLRLMQGYVSGKMGLPWG